MWDVEEGKVVFISLIINLTDDYFEEIVLHKERIIMNIRKPVGDRVNPCPIITGVQGALMF